MSKERSEPGAVATGFFGTKPSRRLTGSIQSALAFMRAHKVIAALIALALFTVTALGLKYLDEDAKRKLRAGVPGVSSPHVSKGSSSWLDSVNPFMPAALPSPTPQLSKEYIYAGSRLLAVEDANANAAPPADLAVWRPSTGYWYVLGGVPGSQQTFYPWGLPTDKPVPGDYDGDGKTDFSVYRPSTTEWYILNSSDGNWTVWQWGLDTDIRVPADYDGDGKTDRAIFRPSTSTWYIVYSSNGAWFTPALGQSGDTPAPADYDGDGRADVAVYRGSDTKFYYQSTANNLSTQTIHFGSNGDTPVPADYDGDGRADAAVWRPGVYQWHILYSSTLTTQGFTFGDPNSDINVVNDYDGDGKADRAFWRPSEGKWYIVQSSRIGQPDELRIVQWGMNGDIPVPAYYRR